MYTLEHVKYKDILSIEQLEINSKQITSIIGESGVGKSTLLKLLNHLESYDHGDIYYNGNTIHLMNPIELRRSVTMLAQKPAIFDGTVKDNLSIGLLFAEKDEPSEEEMLNALTIVHLDKSLDTDAHDLSGGEQQRLALARLILIDSPTILLDEPTSALDDATADTVIDQFLSWAQKANKTIIMVTHSKDIARKFSDVIIKLSPQSNPEVVEL